MSASRLVRGLCVGPDRDSSRPKRNGVNPEAPGSGVRLLDKRAPGCHKVLITKRQKRALCPFARKGGYSTFTTSAPPPSAMTVPDETEGNHVDMSWLNSTV